MNCLPVGEDDHVLWLQQDRGSAVWVAELDGGEEVYMDDGRPGADPPQAWLRLLASGRTIRSLWLKFRSNEVRPLPRDAAGYFFCRSLVKTDGMASALSFYLIGHLEAGSGRLRVLRYLVPELVLVDESWRDAGRAAECLWTRGA